MPHGAGKGVDMPSRTTDGRHFVADRLATWHRPVTTEPAGRVCSEPGCDTRLSIYNTTERCSVHHQFVTIVQRSTARRRPA